MKKLTLLVALSIIISGVASAQVAIQNTNQNSIQLNGQNTIRNVGTTTRPLNQNQGTRIKSLEERRQEQFSKQQQQLEKSGIHIQTIQNPQQGRVMNVNPSNLTPAQSQSTIGVQGNTSGTVNTGN